MVTDNNLVFAVYDPTQLGYIRLQTALNLLDYLAGLYVDELPESLQSDPNAIRTLTIALEADLRAYVREIAPDLLPPVRKTARGVGYLRPRQPFTGGRPRKPAGDSVASEPPPAAGRRGGEAEAAGGAEPPKRG